MDKKDYIESVDKLIAPDELKKSIISQYNIKKLNTRKNLIRAACFIAVIAIIGVISAPQFMKMGSKSSDNAIAFDSEGGNAFSADQKAEAAVDNHILFALSAIPEEEQKDVLLSDSYYYEINDEKHGDVICVILTTNDKNYSVIINHEDTEIYEVK